MAKNVQWYADLTDDMYDYPDNAQKRADWESIEMVRNVEVNIPDTVASKYPDGKFASSVPRDILEGVVTFLSSRLPLIKVSPMRHERSAKEHAEIQASAYDWHFALANQRDEKPFLLHITADAVWKSRICFRTEYLPWEAKRKKGRDALYSKDQMKAMRRFGDFRFIRYEPETIYSEKGAGLLKTVAEMSVMSYRQLQNEYGEADAVKRAIAKNLKDKEPGELRSNYVSLRSVYDGQKRVIFFSHNGTSKVFQTGADEYFTVLDEEHKLPFIPWVIQDFGEPLALGVVRSGAYDKLATLDLIQFSEWIRTAERGKVIQTPNTDRPDVNYDEDGNMIVGSQTTVTPAPPAPVDPQWMVDRNILEQGMRFSLKGESLSNIGSLLNGKNPYSGINLAQSTAISQLSPVIMLVERAVGEGVHQMCRWIKHSGDPLLAYRRSRRNDEPSGDMGARKMVAPYTDQTDQQLRDGLEQGVAYIDPESTMVEVTLQPNNIQDDQAAWNLAIIKQQAGATQKYALETLVREPDDMMKEKIEEQFTLADVARRIKNDDALNDVQIKIAQMMVDAQAHIDSMMQQAQQAQQQPAPGQPPPPGQGQPSGVAPNMDTAMQGLNASAQYAAMKGQTPRAGGPPASAFAPRETRNTVNGTSDGGEQMT